MKEDQMYIARPSDESNANGQCVSVQLLDNGKVRITDTKPGREGDYTDIDPERWESLLQAAQAGKHDGMDHKALGVEWFGEAFAIMKDDTPRYDEAEMVSFLGRPETETSAGSGVKGGNFTIDALTRPPVLAGSVLA